MGCLTREKYSTGIAVLNELPVYLSYVLEIAGLE
jgi:hypothetical protein